MMTINLVLLALLAAGATKDATQSSIDSIFTPLTNARSPGLAVLIRKDNRTIFQRGYGAGDLRTFRKIDSKTDFRLASFTKQFTALSIMLLVHDGKLRYNQPITDVFPDFPEYGRAITVRHLLTHTAGLPDYEELMGPSWTPVHQIQDGEVLSLLEHQTTPKFAAGTKWAYSNSAYVLLGLMVAKVSGEPFEKFLNARIFAPLHMTGTLAFVAGRNNVPNRAFGHTREAGRFIETDQSSTSATLGDGGIYSNLEDLAKWDAALEAHTLLGKEEMRAAVTPAKLNDDSLPSWPANPGEDNLKPGQPILYGFGWFLDPYQDHARMWHAGSTIGFQTVIERFPAGKLTIVILCNRTDLDPSELALRVASVFWKH